MSSIVPTISGPKRPQDKVLLSEAGVRILQKFLMKLLKENRKNIQKLEILIMKFLMDQY